LRILGWSENRRFCGSFLQPSRAKYFREELINSLFILQEGHAAFDTMRGSWAGAMGQCQFMPSSFRNFAVDFDGDGKAGEAFGFASEATIMDLWGGRSRYN
jgi:hypothetical protein